MANYVYIDVNTFKHALLAGGQDLLSDYAAAFNNLGYTFRVADAVEF